eukprot:NODE_9856_length_560_cov_8.670481_g9217_i0.p1 GENE.NODE_9856_length_560_cov_8.670481_g9217_i0~~NODE_9856_length_560_cov_8.670481_g9217_i0.p1  ORF type:complete len:174 (-),score=38.93 NODE_9856_length_560_cov_8.670481_g9217_i0:38-514(-)
MAWTRDNRILYYIDSPTLQVKAFEYDIETGNVGRSRVAIDFTPYIKRGTLAGAPDGMTIDENDTLWVAMFRGSAVTHWNPVTGDLLDIIKLPVPYVTSCCFGGTKMKTLFITTAKGSSNEEIANNHDPLSGCVFYVNLPHKGASSFPYVINQTIKSRL